MPFRLGIEEYEHSIKFSVDRIQDLLAIVDKPPLFDFDEKRTRFPNARYAPSYFLKRFHAED